MVKVKKDKYKSARGGYSRFYNIHCRQCDKVVVEYQKDGKGALCRLYFDRIFWPEKMAELRKKNIKDIKPLKCPDCGFIMGMPIIHEREKRKAFRLFQSAFIKRIKKNKIMKEQFFKNICSIETTLSS